MERIGFLQFGAMADVLYATPILRHIRQLYPDAHITWCIRDKFAEVIETNPYLDEIKKYTLPSGYATRQDAEHVMWKQMKEESATLFNKVFKPQQWPDHNFWRSNLDLISLMAENANFSPNEISDRRIVLNITNNDKYLAAEFLAKNNIESHHRFITCNHISYAASSIWSLDKYQQLVDILAQSDIKCVFTGARGEPIPERAIDAREIPYRQWAGLINISNLWLGLDSGAKALAASVESNTPMIILHSNDFPIRKTGCVAMGIRKSNIIELCPAPTVSSIADIIASNLQS